MKVVVAGFTDYVNYGDQFIAQCVEYLIKQVNCTAAITELSFEAYKGGIVHKALNVLCRVSRDKGWHRLLFSLIKINKRTVFREKLQGADAVIVSGGSFKYGTQLVWAYYSAIVEMAEKYRIPVMFDAMNVQRFDGNDWRCRCLKRHLNYPCVKMFTSRDGLPGVERIREFYQTNPNLQTYPVGDPAYWIKECYGLCRNEKSAVVGINLIQAKNFVNYGGTLSEEALLCAYTELVKELERHAMPYELFTNGLPGDYRLGQRLVERLKNEGISTAILRAPHSARELAEMIAGYRLIVGARLHACICAYSLDIPVVGIVWDEKLRRFSEMAQMEEAFLDEETLSGKNLFAHIEKYQDSVYDQTNKEKWKMETKRTIGAFLSAGEKNGENNNGFPNPKYDI